MAEEFLALLYLVIFGFLATLPMIIIPFIFAPKRPNPIKLTTFEAGQIPSGESRVHLMMQYYSYLLMFVVFDVIIMFLFAWGITFKSFGLTGLTPILLFLSVIFITLGYALYLAGRRELW
ncbi:NAD(P)H-quinone oxidoreductase subunit 3 [archaeon HR06]|nr:NAD(P)H-quinone oxidoreductase subunit 3 [archaeon HR06]